MISNQNFKSCTEFGRWKYIKIDGKEIVTPCYPEMTPVRPSSYYLLLLYLIDKFDDHVCHN